MVRLIDSFEFQRLRRIKQLGLALFTYQGAEHSRFAHSLGALHLMTRVLDRLTEKYDIPDEARAAARAAALLHDTGHGPFSHVMEKVLNFHHEEWTRRVMLSEETEVGQILRDYSAELPDAVGPPPRARTHRRGREGLVRARHGVREGSEARAAHARRPHGTRRRRSHLSRQAVAALRGRHLKRPQPPLRRSPTVQGHRPRHA